MIVISQKLKLNNRGKNVEINNNDNQAQNLIQNPITFENKRQHQSDVSPNPESVYLKESNASRIPLQMASLSSGQTNEQSHKQNFLNLPPYQSTTLEGRFVNHNSKSDQELIHQNSNYDQLNNINSGFFRSSNVIREQVRSISATLDKDDANVNAKSQIQVKKQINVGQKKVTVGSIQKLDSPIQNQFLLPQITSLINGFQADVQNNPYMQVSQRYGRIEPRSQEPFRMKKQKGKSHQKFAPITRESNINEGNYMDFDEQKDVLTEGLNNSFMKSKDQLSVVENSQKQQIPIVDIQTDNNVHLFQRLIQQSNAQLNKKQQKKKKNVQLSQISKDGSFRFDDLQLFKGIQNELKQQKMLLYEQADEIRKSPSFQANNTFNFERQPSEYNQKQRNPGIFPSKDQGQPIYDIRLELMNEKTDGNSSKKNSQKGKFSQQIRNQQNTPNSNSFQNLNKSFIIGYQVNQGPNDFENLRGKKKQPSIFNKPFQHSNLPSINNKSLNKMNNIESLKSIMDKLSAKNSKQGNSVEDFSSIQQLQNFSKELDPRASSLWKKKNILNSQKNEAKSKLNKQQEFFKQYLKNEIQKIEQFSALPSFEAMYARQKQYHPDKVKIQNLSNLKFANILKRDSKDQSLISNYGIKNIVSKISRVISPVQQRAIHSQLISLNKSKNQLLDQNEKYSPDSFTNQNNNKYIGDFIQNKNKDYALFINKKNINQSSEKDLNAFDQSKKSKIQLGNKNSIGKYSEKEQVNQASNQILKQYKNQEIVFLKSKQQFPKYTSFNQSKQSIQGIQQNTIESLQKQNYQDVFVSKNQSIDSTLGPSQSEMSDDMYKYAFQQQNDSVYETNLFNKMNSEFSNNKLFIKQYLISKALSKHKPRKRRAYVDSILKNLKDLKVQEVQDLPANKALEITIEIVRSTLTPVVFKNVQPQIKKNKLQPNRESELNISQISEKRSGNESIQYTRRSIGSSIFEQESIMDFSNIKEDQKVTAQQLMLRKIDDLPYFNKKNQVLRTLNSYVEPVYLSPHFDIETQQFIEPKHLNELLLAIKQNSNIKEFERYYLIERIKEQTNLKVFDLKEMNKSINKVKQSFRHLNENPQSQIYEFLEKCAYKLYSYISRQELNEINKLGVLADFLSNLVADDLKNQDQKKFKESQQSILLRIGKNISTKMVQKTSEISYLKQKPYQQPKSEEFFESVRDNDVLKCLKMLKENQELTKDVDEERKTALHWCCQLNFQNLFQVLVDFNANLFATDDFARKPLDEATLYAQIRGVPVNPLMQHVYEQANQGTLKRSIKIYDDPMFVKYLTPVEKVKELADFIRRVNDMSTLTQNLNDDTERLDFEKQKNKKYLDIE